MTGTKTGTIVPETFTAPRAVWIYDTSAAWIYGDERPPFKAFASEDAANRWFEKNDPEGVAFEIAVEE